MNTVAVDGETTHRWGVLVVEDDSRARAFFEASVQRSPSLFWLGSAGTVREALAWLADTATIPDVLLVDLGMPDGSGLDVIRHAVAYLKENEGQVYDYIVLLEPTSPLREDDDIDNMLESLLRQADEFDSIVSVGEVTEHPSIMKRLVGARMEPFCPDLPQTTRRQDNAAAYFPFGVAYIAKTDVLLAENTFYTRRCTHYEIKRYQNYEIDDIYNFLCVEAVMKHEWGMV